MVGEMRSKARSSACDFPKRMSKFGPSLLAWTRAVDAKIFHKTMSVL